MQRVGFRTMPAPVEPLFAHVDLDAFYASVEQAEHPELKGQPVIIGALPGHRGVVSACSYEARVFGVHSAMPISQAYRRCPDGVYLIPRMKRYQEISRDIMSLLSDYSPEVTQISIDEAALDLTGTERLFGPPEQTAARIKKNIADRFGLTISVGIAPNRYLAKLASEAKKPDGLVRVRAGEEEPFLDTLDLSDLWGIGDRMIEQLTELDIHSMPVLRSYPEDVLQELVGRAAGSYLYRVCRGINPGVYNRRPKNRSISTETTFEQDTRDRDTIARVLLDLSHQVMFRLLDEGYRSNTVQVKVRFADFSTTTVRKTLGHAVASAEELHQIACELLGKRWSGGERIRLIGIGLVSLERTGEPEQETLFEDQHDRQKRVEKSVLGIHKKHKGTRVIKASLLDARNNRRQKPPQSV